MSEEEHVADYSAYVTLASEVAGAPLRGRSGFGALRHYEEILRESVRLVVESGFFVAPESSEWPFLGVPDPEFWHFFFRRRPRRSHRFLFDKLLASPARYSPPCIWALFWALAKAQHEFLERYVPFWSHEERLTGHLVALMIDRLEDFGSHWRALGDGSGSDANCRIWYADTATARREKVTGADLGLIVHARFHGCDEYCKVARFQAKKVGANGKATIELQQAEALLGQEGLGYYLFYHFADRRRWSLAPTVQPAERFRAQVEKEKQEGPKRNLGSTSENVCEDGFDLATFITFGITDQASEYGVLETSPAAAVSAVMAGPAGPPSRVLVVTLGSGMAVVDWRHLSQEWIGSNLGGE
jgi:hypothetical protein